MLETMASQLGAFRPRSLPEVELVMEQVHAHAHLHARLLLVLTTSLYY